MKRLSNRWTAALLKALYLIEIDQINIDLNYIYIFNELVFALWIRANAFGA